MLAPFLLFRTRVIVALDGPAGSGKSTTARRVADRLGWLYLDTGAMYRTVGLAFVDRGLPVTDADAEALVPTLQIDLVPSPDGLTVRLDGVDVSDRIRTAEAAEAASRVSALPAVRAEMVEQQRAVARRSAADGRGVVAEGRDIGTVVFPDAPVKFFLTADLDARAARRTADLAAKGEAADLGAVRRDIAERDRRDAERAHSPLVAAPDARPLDTTALSVDEQVERVLAAVREAIPELAVDP